MPAITAPGAPKPSPYLSSAIQTGNTLYLSGQCGVSPETGEFISGTVGDRTKRAMKNVEAILQAAGMTLADGATFCVSSAPLSAS